MPAKDSWSKTTWKLGVIWDVADDRLLYLTASTGFRSGGFNFGQTNPNKLYYEPEDLHAIELGSKNLFNDGRVKLNLSAFYYDYEDLQVFQLINDAAYVQNAAEAEIKGIETEFVFENENGITINGNLTIRENTKVTIRSKLPLEGGKTTVVILNGNLIMENNSELIITSYGMLVLEGSSKSNESTLNNSKITVSDCGSLYNANLDLQNTSCTLDFKCGVVINQLSIKNSKNSKLTTGDSKDSIPSIINGVILILLQIIWMVLAFLG